MVRGEREGRSLLLATFKQTWEKIELRGRREGVGSSRFSRLAVALPRPFT